MIVKTSRLLCMIFVASCVTTQMFGMAGLRQSTYRISTQGINARTTGVPDIPDFDVMSVKPNANSDGKFGLRFNQDGFSAQHCTLRTFIIVAYFLKDGRLIENLPEGKEATYDIEAKVAQSDLARFKQLTYEQKLPMLQRLLAERFQLKVHLSKKQIPVYALVVSPKGVRLSPAKTNEAGKIEKTMHVTGRYTLTATGWTADDFFQFLSEVSGRYVVNRTGLKGAYDFTLTCAPDPSVDSRPDSTFDGPIIFTALREQLGLVLEPSTAMLDAVVVDHVEAPSPN